MITQNKVLTLHKLFLEMLRHFQMKMSDDVRSTLEVKGHWDGCCPEMHLCFVHPLICRSLNFLTIEMVLFEYEKAL